MLFSKVNSSKEYITGGIQEPCNFEKNLNLNLQLLAYLSNS